MIIFDHVVGGKEKSGSQQPECPVTICFRFKDSKKSQIKLSTLPGADVLSQS